MSAVHPPTTAAYQVAALYRFVDLPDHAEMRDPLQQVCADNGVKGTLLLAREGINGTIAGPAAGIEAVLAWLRADPRLATLHHKTSWADEPPFQRLKVKLKKEIVTLRVPELDPNKTVGQYVKPRDWNALISQPDVVLVDTRNDYEVAIGTFEGAINPAIKSFTELPAWVAQQPALQAQPDVAGEPKKPRVAMFCTGGIRCEKSTALMKMLGYEEVYHLEGGILQYLEDVPQEQSLWRGDCYVFDKRISVGHGLVPGPHQQCRACGWPVSPEDKASPSYVEGVSCPHCVGAVGS